MSATDLSAPPTGATNAEIVRWTIGRLNAKDLDALRTVWTPQTVERLPSQTVTGGDAIAGYFAGVFAAMPDIHFETIGLAESGEDVYLHWHVTGHHTGGPFEGIEATGRAIALDGMDHFTVRDGRIAANFVVFDQMQFARCVGLLPPDGSAQDRGLKAAFNLRAKAMRRLRR
jgi:predicted ester cyclase